MDTIEVMIVGDGDEAQDYSKVVVNYTGTLEDGSIFDSTLKPGRESFTFTLGVGSVIKGWDLVEKSIVQINNPNAYGIIPRNAEQSFALNMLLDS